MDMTHSAHNTQMDYFAMQPKIQKEIAFLKMRIDAIKSHHTPNHSMLKNFESMLESREDVLLKMHSKLTLSRIKGRLG